MTRTAMRCNPPVESRAWRSAAPVATGGVECRKSWAPGRPDAARRHAAPHRHPWLAAVRHRRHGTSALPSLANYRSASMPRLLKQAEAATGSFNALASPTHVLAAVGREVGAGDPAGLVGDEERDRVGDLLRRTQPPGRDLR